MNQAPTLSELVGEIEAVLRSRQDEHGDKDPELTEDAIGDIEDEVLEAFRWARTEVIRANSSLRKYRK